MIAKDSSSLNHALRYKQWLLTHEMSSSHEIDCFISRSAQAKSFLKALLMNESLKNEPLRLLSRKVVPEIKGGRLAHVNLGRSKTKHVL